MLRHWTSQPTQMWSLLFLASLLPCTGLSCWAVRHDRRQWAQDGVVEEAGFLYRELVVLRTQGIQEEVHGSQPGFEDFTRIRVDTFEALFFLARSHRLAALVVLHVERVHQVELDAVKAVRLACLKIFSKWQASPRSSESTCAFARANSFGNGSAKASDMTKRSGAQNEDQRTRQCCGMILI